MSLLLLDDVLIWKNVAGQLATAMGEDLFTDPISATREGYGPMRMDNVTVSIFHTSGSSPVGRIEIQARNRDTEAWITVDGTPATVPIADGAVMYRLPTPPGRWIRGAYIFTSGTATISGSVFGAMRQI